MTTIEIQDAVDEVHKSYDPHWMRRETERVTKKEKDENRYAAFSANLQKLLKENPLVNFTVEQEGYMILPVKQYKSCRVDYHKRRGETSHESKFDARDFEDALKYMHHDFGTRKHTVITIDSISNLSYE